MFKMFMEHYPDQDPATLTDEHIRQYLLYLVNEKKVSGSYQNQAVNAIKFYYEKVLGRPPKTYYLDLPRRQHRLPSVLSEEEVAAIFKRITNQTHRTILYLIYSAGLRLSELINLKPSDIDVDRKAVIIRQGKGNKDRMSLLSDKALQQVREYLMRHRPTTWLFENYNGGQYSKRGIQRMFSEAKALAGIAKPASIHTLRHSFATHLLEHGTDIRYIQNLLGHRSVKTTEIYTHVTKRGFDQIKSPLDRLDLE
jgi:site-specific recombinase XerD